MRTLYIFTNTVGNGYTGFENCYSMADDGTILGNHLCSNVSYMYGDLVARSDRMEKLEKFFNGKKGVTWDVVALSPGELPPQEVLDLHKALGVAGRLPDDEKAGITVTVTDDDGSNEREIKIP